MLEIKPSSEKDVTKLACPECGEKIPRVGLEKNSEIKGLAFKCRKCGQFWSVTTK